MNPILPDLPAEIITERLLLRCYRPGDGAVYFGAQRSNWDHLHEFLPEDRMALQYEEDAEALIRKLSAEWQLRNLFIFGVWQKATGTYAGETYLANADWHVSCIELGYFVLRESTGKGIAVEAALAAIRFAFDYLGVSRIDLRTAADNEASIRVAERCGFQHEGRQRLRWRKDGADPASPAWPSHTNQAWAGRCPLYRKSICFRLTPGSHSCAVRQKDAIGGVRQYGHLRECKYCPTTTRT